MIQGKEKTMTEKKQILIDLRKGIPIRRISREQKVHRDIIRAILKVAKLQGWLNPDALLPTESDIANILQANRKSTHELDLHLEAIKAWKAEGYTAVVIQQLLKNGHGYSVKIGALRRYLNKNFEQKLDPVMVRSTTAGKTMEVDFGFLGYLWDESAGKLRKAWVFSARLCHSRKAYRRIVLKQHTPTFLMCHVYAFEHFGGVPAEVVLDNLKAGVTKSTVDNEMLNLSYLGLAEHYGFRISPCLPRTPQHKGGVENDMNYVKRNFWPQIKEILKVNPTFSIHRAQEAIEQWDREIASKREIRGLRRSPEEIFATEEKFNLKPLPENRWEQSAWIQCTVGRDWRVVHEGSYYSVPYMLIGQTVQCRVTNQFFEVFFCHDMMAKHPKATVVGDYRKNPEHAPPFKEAVLNCTREGLLENAQEIGEETHKLCQIILSDLYVDKLRPVRRILSLAISYEKERLNNACKRALSYKTFSYRSVKDILEKGLDQEPIHSLPVVEKVHFRFARDPKQYKCTP